MTATAHTRATLRLVPPTAVPTPAAVDAVRRELLDLVRRFRRDQADGVDAVFLLRVEHAGQWTLTVRDGHCVVVAGRTDQADVTVACTPDTLLDFTSGRVDPITAFQAGDLRVEGDLNLALRLQSMFAPGSGGRPLVTHQTRAGGTRVESMVLGRSTAAGTGSPLLLLHGLGASKVSFVPTMAAMAADHEVHALDLPGFGRSEKPLPGRGRYSIGWFADVVHDYVRAHDLGPVHLVGNSMGGRIALEVALRHPSATRSVTGLCPAVSFDVLQRLGPLLRHSRYEWAALAPIAAPRTLLSRGIEALFHDPTRLPPDNIRAAAVEVHACLRDRRYRLATMSAARHLAAERARGRHGYWRRLQSLAVPSLWIFGASDVLVPGGYGHRVATHLPSADVEIWDDCGHVPQFEVPERTHARLRQFLATT